MTFFLLLASYYGWDGGATVGPRDIIAIYPFIFLLAGFAYTMFPRLFRTIGVLSIVLNLAITLVGNEIPSSIGNPLGGVVFKNLRHGNVSINPLPLSHLEKYASEYPSIYDFADVGKWKPNCNSFNLGELLFPNRLISAVPLLCFWGGWFLIWRKLTGGGTPLPGGPLPSGAAEGRTDCGRVIHTPGVYLTVYEGYLQHVPGGLYFSVLPGPVSTITSIKYYAADHTESTWASTNYHLDATASPNRVWLRDGGLWSTSTRIYQPMLVTFTAGYGAAASSVPEAIKHAIKLMASHWWENRTPINIGNIVNQIPDMQREILQPYRYLFFGVEE